MSTETTPQTPATPEKPKKAKVIAPVIGGKQNTTYDPSISHKKSMEFGSLGFLIMHFSTTFNHWQVEGWSNFTFSQTDITILITLALYAANYVRNQLKHNQPEEN